MSDLRKSLKFIVLLIGIVILISVWPFIKKATNKQYNIILISIDTLRADHLGCYGYQRATSPNIDKFAKGGILLKIFLPLYQKPGLQ